MKTKNNLLFSIAVIEIVAVSLLYVVTMGINQTSGDQMDSVSFEVIDVWDQNKHINDTDNSDNIVTLQERKNITLNLVGDIMLASTPGVVIKEKGPDYPWAGVRDVLASSDITIGNLECAVGSGDYLPIPDKQFTFLADPISLEGVKNAGIDVLTLANNHVLDFGVEALMETTLHLDEYGIIYTGAGKDTVEASKPLILEKDGFKVGILAYTYIFPQGWWVAGKNHPGVASGHNQDLLIQSLLDLESDVHFTVVSVHWGQELADNPSESQKQLARKLVDSGADLVLGHHPHVLQGVERYKDGIIAYSTGNFIFTLSRDARGRQSGIFQVELSDEGIIGARIIPTWINYGRTDLADKDSKTEIISRLQSLSHSLGTSMDVNGEIDLKKSEPSY